MAGPSADRITEWEGGSLSELVAMLQAAALPVRIEVIAPGTTDSISGEVHLLAGGMADAFAGSLRRDDAMAALQRLEGARYVIECRLPDPESGSLSEPGPHQGSLKDRPLASLMRYCEDYVLTCRLEVWRGQDRAAISYRRGEIIGTIVGGSEGSERLPEVLGWTDGSYEIILPAPVLPHMPPRGREGAGARPERKRHTTLPMMPGQEPKMDGPAGAQAAAKTDAGPKSAATHPSTTPPPRPATTPPPRPASATPGPPVVSGLPRVAPPLAAQRPAPQPPQPAAARPPVPQPAAQAQPGPATQKPGVRPPLPPAAVTPRPVVAVLAAALQPELTTRGTPPVPAVPLVPAQAPQPAPRPTMQGTGVPLLPPKPAAPVQPKAVAPTAPVKAQRRSTPLVVQPPPQPLPKPAAPAQLAPAAPAVPPAAQPAPAAPAVPPAAQPAHPAEKPATARQPKPSPSPAVSNDLLPASGTIQAKPKHGSYLPPTTPPIQIAEDPPVAPTEQPPTPVAVPNRPPKPKRERIAARKGFGEHPVRAYVFVGLAIGAGIVLAYWAYWYLPFGHH